MSVGYNVAHISALIHHQSTTMIHQLRHVQLQETYNRKSDIHVDGLVP